MEIIYSRKNKKTIQKLEQHDFLFILTIIPYFYNHNNVNTGLFDFRREEKFFQTQPVKFPFFHPCSLPGLQVIVYQELP